MILLEGLISPTVDFSTSRIACVFGLAPNFNSQVSEVKLSQLGKIPSRTGLEPFETLGAQAHNLPCFVIASASR